MPEEELRGTKFLIIGGNGCSSISQFRWPSYVSGEQMTVIVFKASMFYWEQDSKLQCEQRRG